MVAKCMGKYLCCDLESAGSIVGWCGVIATVLNYVFFMASDQYHSQVLDVICPIGGHEDTCFTVPTQIWILTVTFVLSISLFTILLVGVHKKYMGYILTWLICSGMVLFFYLVELFFEFTVLKSIVFLFCGFGYYSVAALYHFWRITSGGFLVGQIVVV